VSTFAPRSVASRTRESAFWTASSLISGPIWTPPRAAADLERLHPLGDTCRELIGNGFVHDEPVGGRTGLTDVAELGQHRTVNRRTKISIIEDQERRIAAQLHGGTQNPSAACCSSLRPTSVEPVKLSFRSRDRR
jgi:hypothetical protein